MFLYLQYIDPNVHALGGPKSQILHVAISLQNVTFRHFGHEMGPRGSPRAHTLSGRSPALPDHFYIGPGPQN